MRRHLASSKYSIYLFRHIIIKYQLNQIPVSKHVRYHSTDSSYFVTTPIFYVNGAPHIGHLQSCLYADAFSRIQRLLGKTVTFSTGTDEHGLKIQQAAKLSGLKPTLFCDNISKNFQDVFDKADISYTHFIRTTDKRHLDAVHHFWSKLKEHGFIYKGNYEGFYNVSDETFVAPAQVKEIKDSAGNITMVCADTNQPLEKMQEQNYIFTLSKFADDLLYWLSKDVVKPTLFTTDLEHMIHKGLQDLSVSRERSRLSWGIPVPDDSSQTIYVWLDALVNYLTAAGYPNKNMQWPADCHVIGKDILKFHCIYWPAFLMAAGLEPPKLIFCHSHWTVDHEKMSKSKGNVVDPVQLIEKYDSDGFRYFLLRSTLPQCDANYSEIKIHRLLNAELADTLGNLLSRCCAPVVNKKQAFPKFHREVFENFANEQVQDLIKTAMSLPHIVPKLFMDGDFCHGIEAIMDCLRKTNGFVQFQKPWDIVRSSDQGDIALLDTVLHIALEVLRISGILLQPVVPRLSYCLLDKLNINENERSWKNLQCFTSCQELNNFSVDKPLGHNSNVLYARRKS